MPQSTIAVIFDFDETLAPDSTSSFLDSIGINVPKFWEMSRGKVQEGWDPIPAYLQMMIDESERRPNADKITQTRLQEWGKQVQPFEGASGIFSRLQKHAAKIDPAITVEFYLISSGIREVLSSTRIASKFKDIWACDFDYREDGSIRAVKNVVSFTDKTRFVFQVSKGITGDTAKTNPFLVNKKVPDAELPIPLSQMIVIGDGYTDIPCFSLVQKNGGIAIGVYDRESRERWGKVWEFIEDQRVSHMVSANYKKGSGLDDALMLAVDKVASNIKLQRLTYQA